ncbi:hypothetical protein ABZ478_36240 [Streptomyces sp. NPDC005706]|uniref:hypothetical protein n=1 Tax=Streptomyces sp. NPDC005706 TaxID=3157169 RepID=UPI003411DD4E
MRTPIIDLPALGSASVSYASPLRATLERLEELLAERGLRSSDLFTAPSLAGATALPESIVRTLLQGGEPPADTVNERVRTRIKALADARMARTGERMSELAGKISKQLGVSAFWARQVCSGTKVPSIELLHGLVEVFGVQVGETFFTAPPAEALNRELFPILAALDPAQDGQNSDAKCGTDSRGELADVRGIALRQAMDLPKERWNVLEATLKALLEVDDREEHQ